MLVFLNTSNAEGANWIQTSDHEFNGGALSDVDVSGTDEDAFLQLETAGSGGEWARTDNGPDVGLYGAAAVWDSKRNQVVLFGGTASTFKSDTWLYDPATDSYTLSTSATSPPARRNHAMAYDSESDKVVLFGGLGSSPSYKDDTWLYDPGTDSWEQVFPVSHPSARCYHAMVFDAANEVSLLFGGADAADRFDDTWTYDVPANTWTQKSPATSPSDRYSHAMAYDSRNEVAVLFGGYDGSYDQETWTYSVSSNTWSQEEPSTSPPLRYRHGLAYDSANEEVVLFGGTYGGTERADTWSYSVSSESWTQKSPSVFPTNRYWYTMLYDEARGGVFLLGGTSDSGNQYAKFDDEIVDSTNDKGEWSDIVLDDDGHPHISYFDTSGNDVEYAEWTGSSWSTATVDSSADLGPTAIVLDLQGYPHILYRDASSYDLTHAWKDSGGWQPPETVDSSHDDEWGYGLDLAIDRFGYLHAAYHYYSGTDLYYAKKTSSWGTPQALDTTDSVGYHPSIAVDRDGNPHIAYGDHTALDLNYISSDDGGSTWNSVETVDDYIGTIGSTPYCSIAVDPAGTPFISYMDASFTLGFAYKYGSSWGKENPVATSYYGYFTSLCLDRNGRPHITSYNSDDDYVEYTWLDRGGSWRTTTVDSSASDSTSYASTACAIDAQGRLHVSYYDSGLDLAHAQLLLPNWEYDLSDDAWTVRGETQDGPSDRRGHSMVYDSKAKKAVLFGGDDGDTTLDGSNYNDETWTYDPATRVWQRQFPSRNPSARVLHAMAYDSSNGVTILFGGNDGSNDDETWTYDAGANKWTQKSPSSKPTARSTHAMTYDSANGVTVLFGGYDGSEDHETWTYSVSADSWTQKSPSSYPSARYRHGMAYDSTSGVIVLFGGIESGGNDDETWTYNVATDTWTQKSPASEPSARYSHAMAYDSANGKVVLFSGVGSSPTYKGDTWVYDTSANTWTQKSPASNPSARYTHTMAYDSEGGEIVLFGGYTGLSQLDTWHYRLTDYETAGTYTSQAYGAHADRAVKWGKIQWNAELPAGSDVEFQVAVSNDGTSWSYVGPDGTASTFYNDVTGGELYASSTGDWVRYKAYLRAAPSGDTPELHDVSITWREMTVPTVTLTWPNGGENLMHGESYPITWTASGDMKNSTPVALSYSLDGGNTWTTITSATANDGHYRWTLPSNENVQRAMVKIVVTALDSSTVEDTSDGSFSIDPPPGNPDTMDKVLFPNSGDELTAGDVVRLEWRLSGEDSVSLSYSTDFGQSWNVIIENFDADTIYNWKTPDDLSSENVLVKVKGQSTEIISGIFMIGEGIDEGNENKLGEASNSDETDPTHVVTGGLTALILCLLVALVVVVRYKPKEGKKK